MIYKAGSGHPGGSLSMLKIIAALYFGKTSDGQRIMRYDPKDPNWVNRDRFVLSKGHAAPGLYAALGRAGFFPVSEFDNLRKLGSMLQGHTDMTKTPGIDMSAGSLGVAISAATGMAIAAKMDGRDYTVNVMLGDGESQEGQVDEAARHAAAIGLDNMIAFLDWNGMQIDGKVTDVDIDFNGQAVLWQDRGWNVITANGEMVSDVVRVIEKAKITRNGKPTVIIAKTIKGAGLPGMDKHGAAPKEEEVKTSTEIIEKDLSGLAGEGFNKDKFIKGLLPKIALDQTEKNEIDGRNTEAAQARRTGGIDLLQAERAQSIIKETLKPYAEGKNVSTRTANGDELLLLGAEDPDVVVMSADLKGSVMFDKFEKAFGVFSARNPTGRYIPIGIREAHMASLATGLASCGKIPVIGTFSIFTTRMPDQLNAILNTKLPIVIVGTHGGLATGPDGRTHQDAHSQGILGALPGVKLLEGADAEETRVLARHIYESTKREGGIYYIRPARLDTPILPKPEGWQEGARKGFYTLYDSEAGKPKQAGRYDVAIVSTGVVGVDAVEAAKELAGKGKRVRVVNVCQLTAITDERNAAEFA
ncbi:MAG: hypothetical protein HY880_01920, partial [Deltaproteobacteria bacterium]|nr:hypothetical protein [Deltaproteobacteria bacterium]